VIVDCVPNALVMRVGDGAAPLSATAAAVQLEEYRPTGGAPLRTLAIPSSGPNRLTLAGDDYKAGHVARSGDGRFLTFVGYDANAGTASVKGTSSSVVARVVGKVDLAGSYTVPVAVTDSYDKDGPRSVISMDGIGYWLVGPAGGLHFTIVSSSTSVLIPQPPTTDLSDGRYLGFFDGRLYASSMGNFWSSGVLTFTSAMPYGQEASTTVVGSAVQSDGFALVDVDPNVPGVDTLYYAVNVTQSLPMDDNKLIVRKSIFDGGTWNPDLNFQPMLPTGTSTDFVPTHGLAAIKTATGVRVYVTTSSSAVPTAPNMLVTFFDDGTTETPPVTILAHSPSNAVYRGVALSPTP
jgi:hypothetical protein